MCSGLQHVPSRVEEVNNPVLVADAILTIPHSDNVQRAVRDDLLSDVHAPLVLKERGVPEVDLARLEKQRLSRFQAKPYLTARYEDAVPRACTHVLVGEGLDPFEREAPLAYEVPALQKEVPLTIHEHWRYLSTRNDNDQHLPKLHQRLVHPLEAALPNHEARVVDEVHAALEQDGLAVESCQAHLPRLNADDADRPVLDDVVVHARWTVVLQVWSIV
mmetsp:Transcript_56681/g.165851  ORF Transcript_56681/g.165851 Transcript_56681/m.165851 type:complete len:218 (-) Transcript_56681:672-1325(-)